MTAPVFGLTVAPEGVVTFGAKLDTGPVDAGVMVVFGAVMRGFVGPATVGLIVGTGRLAVGAGVAKGEAIGLLCRAENGVVGVFTLANGLAFGPACKALNGLTGTLVEAC